MPFDTHRNGYNINRVCRVLNVAYNGYCQWRNRLPTERAKANAALDAEGGGDSSDQP